MRILWTTALALSAAMWGGCGGAPVGTCGLGEAACVSLDAVGLENAVVRVEAIRDAEDDTGEAMWRLSLWDRMDVLGARQIDGDGVSMSLLVGASDAPLDAAGGGVFTTTLPRYATLATHSVKVVVSDGAREIEREVEMPALVDAEMDKEVAVPGVLQIWPSDDQSAAMHNVVLAARGTCIHSTTLPLGSARLDDGVVLPLRALGDTPCTGVVTVANLSDRAAFSGIVAMHVARHTIALDTSD